MTREFRFGYFTSQYDATVAFYRDALRFPILESWDRDAEDRGTLFRAGSGIIEVLHRPGGVQPSHLWDERPPQGAFIVVEVDDVKQYYNDLRDRGVVMQQELTDHYWGHRGFCLREPNGLTLFVFSPLDSLNSR